MGGNSSKHRPAEPDESFKGLCDEGKAVFEKHYASELASNPFANNASVWPPELGLYLYDAPPLLVMKNKGNRASDVALHAAYQHLKPYSDPRLMIISGQK